MYEQKYEIEKIKAFDLKDIFECGQCFRWNKNKDESYTGVVKENVINVKIKENKIIFTSMGKDNLEELVNEYFDLHKDYEEIKKELSRNRYIHERKY